MELYKQQKLLRGLKKSVIALTAGTMIAAPGLVYYGIQYDNVTDYENAHQIFEEEKVESGIKYFGGDIRYIDKTFNFFKLKDNQIYNHFNTGHNNRIVVGFSSELSFLQRQQFKYVINYYNDIFSVINPDYHLIVEEKTTIDKCDIFITSSNYTGDLRAQTFNTYDSTNKSQITRSTIKVDEDAMSTPMMRFVLAHELMHVFLGSPDVDWTESQTFSVYNYNDVSFMIDQIENAYNSEEDVPSGFHIVRPIMSKKEQNSFVALTPVDIATFCALYADLDNEEVKQNCLKLIHETLDVWTKYFTDKQPYFEDYFVLPELDEEEEELV